MSAPLTAHPPPGRRLLFAALLATAQLCGCGLKGALYLPQKTPVPANSGSTPASATQPSAQPSTPAQPSGATQSQGTPPTPVQQPSNSQPAAASAPTASG